jgi:hypothetical protein
MNNQPSMLTTRVSEFETANRVHSRISTGTGSDLEIIRIDNKTYTKMRNSWVEGEVRSAEDRQSMAAKMEKLLASSTKDVQSAGSENVNGTPCFVYTYRLDVDLGGKTYSSTGKAWVGANDGLPHQIDGEYKSPSYGSTAHIIYEYGGNIKVEQPQ